MRFCFLDRVLEFEPHGRIVVNKGVSYAEPYLADHFPGAPVLPGAMMIETAFEAARWLLRASRDFSAHVYRVVGLRQAKFARIVRPGDVMTVYVNAVESDSDDELLGFRARGECDGAKVFSARFTMKPSPVTMGVDPDVERFQRRFWFHVNVGVG